MKVPVLIADDEPVARSGLRDMLGEIAWVTCVGEAASGPAAVQAIDTLRPEVVFLDIQMPGLLGTEVLKQITHRPFVVFTTAYAQHAVTAFELGALDYLLKPFGPERLATALERVRAALGEPQPSSAFERLHETWQSGPISRLFVRCGGAVIPVAANDIAWFEAQGDYVVAHVGSAQHLLHLALQRLEKRLDPQRFVRIHRTRIVNLDFVKAFRPHGKGQLAAVMADGARLVVSRNRTKDLRGLGA
jgi:two-component system LytT family response regulator